MAAANAQIGVATAAFYPDADAERDGRVRKLDAVEHLFDWPSRFWSVGACGLGDALRCGPAAGHGESVHRGL